MAKSNHAESLGARLGELRQREGLSIEELAQQVGMKPTYLKSLEEGEILAPVADILTLARTLAVDPSAIMGESPTGVALGGRKKALDMRADNVAYQPLTSEEHDLHLMAFQVTIEPHSEHRKIGYSHEGEEFIYVLSGRLKITLGRKTQTLVSGDHIHFDSKRKHRLSNPGDEPTVLMAVLYTP